MYFGRHALAAYLFLVSASIIIVDKFTIVHPFILADNRHYVFYIYRYFKWSQYLMCLVYPFCFITIIRLIINTNEKLVKFITWGVASMLYLMVSPLVELRYFTVPFVLLALEIRNRNLTFDVERVHKREIKVETWVNRMIYPTLIKIAVNIAVIYVFLLRNFGPDGSSRFIW
jgi:alpha-1,2-glucosyltransferase